MRAEHQPCKRKRPANEPHPPDTLPGPLSSDVVVHLLGKLTDAVFSFLGPATKALAACGVQQVVVMFDDERSRRLRPQFDAAIKLHLVPKEAVSWRGWRALVDVFSDVVAQVAPTAIHVHGAISAFAASRLLRQQIDPTIRSFFSPHSSKFLGRSGTMGTPLVHALRQMYGQQAPTLIANAQWEARSLALAGNSAVNLVECPVPDAFFAVRRREWARPRVLTSGYPESAVAADRYAQLAVLIVHGRNAPVLEWIGGATRASIQRLQAADVQMIDAQNASERARCMAAGWMYVAPVATRGFPLNVAEAMAAGLPCVAIDTPAHRDLIEHGRTGFLYRDYHELAQRIGQLLDARKLRLEMGKAAQRHARSRFSERRFQALVLAAYGAIRLEQPHHALAVANSH